MISLLLLIGGLVVFGFGIGVAYKSRSQTIHLTREEIDLIVDRVRREERANYMRVMEEMGSDR